MITNGSITLWHNNSATFLPNVYIRETDGINKNGIKQKGFFEDKSCIIRIPQKENAEISVGDYIRIGKHSGECDRGSDFRVMKINKNLCGVNPHLKVVCKR